ncbi:MAG: hypothetical protein ACOYXC_08345 [Candidatus Rifleibacteriota bacterium]
MEKYFQAALLAFIAGLIAYALIGYARESLGKGEITSKYQTYKRDEDPIMFWITLIAFYLAGLLMPLVILAFALSILMG